MLFFTRQNDTLSNRTSTICNGIYIRNPFCIKCFRACRSLGNLSCGTREIFVIVPFFKSITISRRDCKFKCRSLNIVNIWIIWIIYSIIQHVNNIIILWGPMSIENDACPDWGSEIKFYSTFRKPAIKLIAFICSRIYRLCNGLSRTNTNKVHLCFSMLIRIKGYRIGYHLSPYCIKSRIFRGKHVQLIQINNWEICRDCLTKRPACKIYRIIAPLFGGFNTVGLRQSPYSFNRNHIALCNLFFFFQGNIIGETSSISIKRNCIYRIPDCINTCRFRCNTKIRGGFRSPF